MNYLFVTMSLSLKRQMHFMRRRFSHYAAFVPNATITILAMFCGITEVWSQGTTPEELQRSVSKLSSQVELCFREKLGAAMKEGQVRGTYAFSDYTAAYVAAKLTEKLIGVPAERLVRGLDANAICSEIFANYQVARNSGDENRQKALAGG